MVVEQCGSCEDGEPDLKRRRLHNARKLKGTTPSKALVKAEEEGMPQEEWPTILQLRDMRKKDKMVLPRLSAQCVGSLQEFLGDVPNNVLICQEHVTISSETIRFPFTTEALLEKAN